MGFSFMFRLRLIQIQKKASQFSSQCPSNLSFNVSTTDSVDTTSNRRFSRTHLLQALKVQNAQSFCKLVWSYKPQIVNQPRLLGIGHFFSMLLRPNVPAVLPISFFSTHLPTISAFVIHLPTFILIAKRL